MRRQDNLLSDWEEIASRSAGDINKLLLRGVIVTGGSGFVGRWLISSLLWFAEKKSIPPRVVSLNRTTPMWQKEFIDQGLLQVVNCDVTREIPDIGEFGYVFHCATPASAELNNVRPAEMERIINEGTERVVRRYEQMACRIVNVSSGAVYGIQPHDVECLDDEWLSNPRYELPNSAYHRGKVNAEKRFNAALNHASFSVVHARLFAFLAPFLPLDTHFAAGNFLSDALQCRPINIRGDARTVRTYMYGTDLVVWLVAAAVRGVSGCAYNIGSPYEMSIRELAETISQQAQSAQDVIQLSAPISAGPVHRYVPCTTRTQRQLGVKLQVQIREAIDRTLRWHQREFQSY